MDYSKWSRQTSKVTNLILDPDNIRLEIEQKNKSQDALLADLFTNENALQILASIAKNGLFPDELPVVIKENNKLIVLEGNRRVAALKAIVNPSIVPGHEARIKEIIKSFSPITQIEVVVAPSRADALKLLADKHTQVTRRRWKPLRQAYFYYAQLERGRSIDDLKETYSNVDIPKYVRMWEFHKIARSLKYDSDEIARKAYEQRSFPVSTVQRLYDDDEFKSLLNFSFDENGVLQIHSAKKEFEEAVKRIVSDAIDKGSSTYIDTRILNDSDKRREYFKNLKTLPSSDKELSSEDFKEKIPPVRKSYLGIAPKDIQFLLQAPAVKRILKELQNINYSRFPHATYDLMRSFLECSLKSYFKSHGHTVGGRNGRVQLEQALSTFIDSSNKFGDADLKQLASSIKGDAGMKAYTAELLNAANHNPYILISPTQVEEAWEKLEPLLRYLLSNKIEK